MIILPIPQGLAVVWPTIGVLISIDVSVKTTTSSVDIDTISRSICVRYRTHRPQILDLFPTFFTQKTKSVHKLHVLHSWLISSNNSNAFEKRVTRRARRRHEGHEFVSVPVYGTAALKIIESVRSA